MIIIDRGPNTKIAGYSTYIINWYLVKSVCSDRDSVWENLVDWVLGYRKDSKNEDSGYSYNQSIE